jgi:hypothetical protein
MLEKFAAIVSLAHVYEQDSKIPSNDFIHFPPVDSIYRRTDYLVNSNMMIPYALANTWRTGVRTELAVRKGLPGMNSQPELTPLVLLPPIIPMDRK